MTKDEREKREYASLMSDQRYAKKAWQEFFGRSLASPAAPIGKRVDKDGKQTLESQIEEMAYQNVKKRLEEDGLTREPMQAELIVEAGIIRARFADSTFSLVLDRTAGKVKDEVVVGTNPYESLTDDELEMLAQYRDQKELALKEGEGNGDKS